MRYVHETKCSVNNIFRDKRHDGDLFRMHQEGSYHNKGVSVLHHASELPPDYDTAVRVVCIYIYLVQVFLDQSRHSLLRSTVTPSIAQERTRCFKSECQ